MSHHSSSFNMALDGDSGASGHRGRVPMLDLLRLLAVLGVVLFHYGFLGPAAHGGSLVALPELSSFARYGFLGVPVFFVISGFVISYSAEGRAPSDFVIARIARIYPGFLFCMTLTFLTVLAMGAPYFQTSFAQWTANLFIAAPHLHQPYMDSAYWSLVVEIIFYAWVAVLMAMGLFSRRIKTVVFVWLCVSMLNEVTIDSPVIDKILLADDSGFFATGILIHELYKGRRDALLQALLATSIAIAVFQAVHNLKWLRGQSESPFDDWVVASICLTSILVILWATRIRSVPLPAGAVIAVGGMTYPFYLLHQQIGYVVYERIGPVARPAILVGAIMLAIALLSWAIWRWLERPSQQWTRLALTGFSARRGWAAKPRPSPTAI
jgi:peptidoglycan/LPS O-acetylase OafA/YrhL